MVNFGLMTYPCFNLGIGFSSGVAMYQSPLFISVMSLLKLCQFMDITINLYAYKILKMCLNICTD